jgi:RimJ/RimL family protein N-acetyltransferase
VTRVTAETYPELVGSIGVLRRCGFRFIGEGSEPGVIRYEITRVEYAIQVGAVTAS